MEHPRPNLLPAYQAMAADETREAEALAWSEATVGDVVVQPGPMQQVLANWIAQAAGPPGQLPEGTDPAQWVAERFLAWWRTQAEDQLDQAEAAMARIRAELEALGGWANPQLEEAMHELIHAADALAWLRGLLGSRQNPTGGRDAEPSAGQDG